MTKNKSSLTSASDGATLPSWKKWTKLVVIALSLAIILIDTTLLNVSLRDIVKDLNSNFTDIQWVITIYTLTLAAFTITGGRLGDLYGRKRMFMLGATLFAIGSFIASISQNITTLLVGESIIEGIGAALMMPAAASLLLTNFTGKDRAVGFAVFGAVAGAASAIGPILGGWLTSSYSWRWGFRINVFVVILLLIGSILIKDSRDTKEKTELDWTGVFLSSTGLLALVFGIIQSSDYGWWMAKKAFSVFGQTIDFFGLSITPIAILVGLILLSLFGWWQLRREKLGHTPLVSLHLFENRQFVSGMAVTAAISLSLTGLIFVFPVYYQAVHGLDAFHTGLALFPLSLTVFFVSPAALALAKKVRPRAIILSGLFITTLAVLTMIVMLKDGVTAQVLMPGLILFGLGMGLVQSQINNLTLSAVDSQFAGEASGVSNTMRQVGSSFGAAIIGAALFAAISSQIAIKIQNDPNIPAASRDKIIEQARVSSRDGGFSDQLQDPNSLPQELALSLAKLPPAQREAALNTYREKQIQVGNAIQSSVKSAITDSVRSTLWIAFGFTLLSVVVGFGLPNIASLVHAGEKKPEITH
ncbi:MFS transporter [Candidatus Saccharibacteria bacterium]|nr:MFS transporter [Candidatus Saccharibacteria bacterium]